MSAFRTSIAALLLCHAACAQAKEVDTAAICSELEKLQPPFADLPTPDDNGRLRGCSSDELYHGIGRKPDLVDARLCAMLEIEYGEPPLFGGAAVLMMIYANGEGVERNIPLAKHYACKVAGAQAELESRLEHLDQIAADPGKAERMGMCDDITSGYMMGECAIHDQGSVVTAREARWSKLIANWPKADQAALASLRTSAATFFNARIENEIDLSGTARTSQALGESNALEDGVLNALSAFEDGKLPAASASEYAAADKELNLEYAAARKAATAEPGEISFGPLGTIRPDGIRIAQRAWLKYRDAWVEFGKRRYPKVEADAWRTHFTRERVKQLKEMYDP